jgi:hypothetical protein
MRWKAGAVVGCVLVLVATGGGYSFYTGSPQYALAQAAKAVESRDRLVFERHVDVEAIVTSGIDDILAGLMADLAQGDAMDGFAALGAALGAAMVEGMKPMIRTAAKEAVYSGIESGDLAGALSTAKANDFSLGEVAGGSLGRSALEGLGKVRREGDVAIAPLRFRESDLDTTLVLELRMERTNKVWRVVALHNLRQFMETLTELQEAAVAAENARIEAELATLIQIGAVNRAIRDQGWFSRSLVLTIEVTNTSQGTITGLYFDVDAGGRNHEAEFAALSPIEQGETRTLRREIRLNAFSSEHDALASARLSVSPRSVVLYRGTTRVEVSRVRSWEDLMARRRAGQ